MKPNTEADKKEYSKRKWKYIFKNVIFIRILPILVIVMMINEGFYNTLAKNENIFIILIGIKVALGIGIGILAGNLEWKFNERLVEGYFKNINEIKKEYVKIFGVLGWGLVIGVSYFRYPVKSITAVFIDLIIWLSFGLLMGIFTWKNMKPKYQRFLRN